MGASGAGKTFLGCALGISVCRNQFTTRYDLAIARGDGSYKKVIAQYKKGQLAHLR
jgi:DNA replication protein DnaC